jgi:hypothetical protein
LLLLVAALLLGFRAVTRHRRRRLTGLLTRVSEEGREAALG